MFNRLSISVIVPVYNVERYVEECLRSVMAQAAPNISVDCIVVDDCGSDRSMDVVRRTLESYSGPVEFKLLAHEENRGLSAARNTGIRAAKGEYVIFLDSDDYLLSDALSNLAKIAEKYPGVDIIQGEVQLKKPNKWIAPYLNVSSVELPEYISGHEKARHTILFDMPVTAWAKLIRRDFILKNGLFFTEGMIHEDDMWAVSASQFLESIAFYFTPVYWYNNDVESSIINNPDKTRSMNGVIKIIENAVDCYNRTPSKDYLEYTFKRLDIKEKIERWQNIKDKKLIKSQLNSLKMYVNSSDLPLIIRRKCNFFTSSDWICQNKYLRFMIDRLLNQSYQNYLNRLS